MVMPSQSLPPSALESGLLGSITSLDRLARLHASGVQQSDFGVWPGVYKFICDYVDEYGGVPLAELIRAKWEEFDAKTGDFEYWLKEFVRHSSARKAEILIRESIKAIEASPELAIPDLVNKLSLLQFAGNSHVVATDASIGERVAKYNARREVYESTDGKFLWGIKTGLDVIDLSHQGWMDGELVGFYARPTVGKTWMLVREAAIAWANGYRVLLISPEVSARHVALRVDVFLANACGISLSHKAIFEGHPSQAEAYSSLSQTIQNSERWWTVDSLHGRPIGIRDLKQLIGQFEPDMICIDGIMLMEDDKRGEGWQKMENLAYGLKNLATAADLVIMVSHQAVNLSKGRRNPGALGRGDDFIMPTLNDASGGEGFGRACSTVFTMAPDQRSPYVRWFSLRKTRERQIEFKPRYALGWDVDRGNIVDLSRYGDDMLVIEPLVERMMK